MENQISESAFGELFGVSVFQTNPFCVAMDIAATDRETQANPMGIRFVPCWGAEPAELSSSSSGDVKRDPVQKNNGPNPRDQLEVVEQCGAPSSESLSWCT